MRKQTPLYEQHLKQQAKMVDFSGWEMPIQYSSLLEEHHAVRNNAGIFDVSHMGVLDVAGSDAKSFLRFALTNDVKKITPGQAIYSCLLNEAGGIVDDLIIYQLSPDRYRLVLNAANRDSDRDWLSSLIRNYDVQLIPCPEYAILALQGPNARVVLSRILDHSWKETLGSLEAFHFHQEEDLLIARTGYTGEDGVEIILPAGQAVTLWEKIIEAQVKPCGLGARDTLRLEAGLNLYGADMNENTSPLVSNLGWTVAWEDEKRDFVGKQALLNEKKHGVEQQLIGLVMEERGVLRSQQNLFAQDEKVGEITSGSFSPTLGHSIALARVKKNVIEPMCVEMRSKRLPVTKVKPPFVRNGKKVFKEIE